MSYLPNMSFIGSLETSKQFKSPVYQIKDGLVSLIIDLRNDYNGTLQVMVSNDNRTFVESNSFNITDLTNSITTNLAGLFFYLIYTNNNTKTENNLQIITKVSKLY